MKRQEGTSEEGHIPHEEGSIIAYHWRYVGTKPGLGPHAIHSLCRAGVVERSCAGANLVTIQKLLGHAGLVTTQCDLVRIWGDFTRSKRFGIIAEGRTMLKQLFGKPEPQEEPRDEATRKFYELAALYTLSLHRNEPKPDFDHTRCVGCGQCTFACSVEALSLERRPAGETPPRPADLDEWMAECARSRGLSLTELQ